MSLELPLVTQASLRVVVDPPVKLQWARSSSSDVQAGPYLVAMCRWLLSSCGMGLHSSCSGCALYLWWVGSSLVVVCRLLYSCGRGGSSLVVVAGLFFSCNRVFFSNCDGVAPF